jgi:transposase
MDPCAFFLKNETGDNMIATYLLREVLRLLLLPSKITQSHIERLTGCPHQTISELNKKLTLSNLDMTALQRLDDDEVRAAIYPKMNERRLARVLPDFEMITMECLRKHKQRKTLMVMYLEYRAKFGKDAYKKSRFFQLTREYMKQRNICMKQLFLPGEILCIDYAGTQVKYLCEGSVVFVPVFVACLGYSKRTFAFATSDMTSLSWTLGLVRALNFIDGIPEVIQFDNAKAMVKKPGIIAVLNDNMRDFSNHYECVCDTSRVASPKDNGNAEAAVKFITQRILIPMKQDLQFFSLDEINQHLLKEVEKLNNLPMQKKAVSRNDLYFADERESLTPLPKQPYAPIVYQTTIKTPTNYHIRYLNNEYSVPFELANKYIDIRVRGNQLYILEKSQVRAIHDVFDGLNNVITIDKHLHPKHQFEAMKNKEEFLRWAKEVSIETEQVISAQYDNTTNHRSRYAGKRCVTLQKLCEKYGEEVFTEACRYGIEQEMTTPSDITLILKAKVYQPLAPTPLISHGNIRGKTYYGGVSHD